MPTVFCVWYTAKTQAGVSGYCSMTAVILYPSTSLGSPKIQSKKAEPFGLKVEGHISQGCYKALSWKKLTEGIV